MDHFVHSISLIFIRRIFDHHLQLIIKTIWLKAQQFYFSACLLINQLFQHEVWQFSFFTPFHKTISTLTLFIRMQLEFLSTLMTIYSFSSKAAQMINYLQVYWLYKVNLAHFSVILFVFVIQLQVTLVTFTFRQNKHLFECFLLLIFNFEVKLKLTALCMILFTIIISCIDPMLPIYSIFKTINHSTVFKQQFLTQLSYPSFEPYFYSLLFIYPHKYESKQLLPVHLYACLIFLIMYFVKKALH